MKTSIRWLFLGILLCAFAPRASALYTSYLDETSNALATAHAILSGLPPDLAKARTNVVAKNAFGKALRDLQRPSTSVATDYNIFISVAQRLLPLRNAGDPFGVGAAVSNAFGSFIFEAFVQGIFTSNRVAALSPYQPQRRAASNQINQAAAALNRVATTDNEIVALFSLRLAFLKIALANKLAAQAEAKPVYAPPNLVGKSIHHEDDSGEESGMLTFDNARMFTESEGDGGTYSYRRTSPTTATLTLRGRDPEGPWTVNVKLTFTSLSGGTFEAREDGEIQTGTFTIE